MADDSDVFSVSADATSTSTSSRLHAHSSGSLPAAIHSQDLKLPAARSRRPLSYSCDLSKLQGILDDGSMTYGSAKGRSNESGFFSDSPASSSSSLYQINEGQRATMDEAMTHFPDQHELDNFNKDELGSLLKDFAEELGGCWREVGRYLLRKECSVENIDADYSKVSEKAYQVLLKWKKENGADASILDIFKCFNHIGREDVAEKVLEYLPKLIQTACEMILLSSPKKIRCPSMTTEIYNVKETPHEMSVEKQLRMDGDDEIHFCVSKKSGKKYILKKIEEGPDNFILAARQAIPDKLFATKKRQLRNTSDFLKEIKIKEDTLTRLKQILGNLMSKLKKDYFGFCKENLDCSNCEKTKTKLELLEKESSLLHHTLNKMLRDNRKLSITGIPTDKIYNLAERTYGICDDHKKMHSEMRKIRRRCSQELLDIEQGQLQEKDEEEDSSEIDDTLECTMNILQRFARRRKVVQSLTPKRRKESKAVQRNKSDKSKSRSRFYVSVRDSFKYKRGNTTQNKPNGLSRTDSKKTKKSFISKDSKIISRKKGMVEKSELHSLQPPISTQSAAIVRKDGHKTEFLGPEDLDLADPNEAYNLSCRAKNTGGQVQCSRRTTPPHNTNFVNSAHKKVQKCNSDPYRRTKYRYKSRNTNKGGERDCHGEAVIDILTQQYERGRSQSDVQTRKKKLSCDESVTKPVQRRDKFLDNTHCLQDSSRDSLSKKSDESFSKSHSAAFEFSSSKIRDQCSAKSQPAVFRASTSVKPSEKGDKSTGKRDKPTEERDQFPIKSQSSNALVASSSDNPTEERDKPTEERDQSSIKSQSSNALAASSGDKPTEKRDKPSDKNLTPSLPLEDPPSVKPDKKRDQLNSQSQSSIPLASVKSSSDKNNVLQETASCENVKWLKDVDTKDIIFV